MSLGPVAYYRLNETTPVPAADLATNSGSLGAAANGYYLDLDSAVGTAEHPSSGVLADPLETAATFAGGRVTIPYSAALNPSGPFTVECWAYKYSGTGYPLGAFSALY